MSDNFYNVLGISENASKDDIKKAYRGLQMKFHPDRNPGNQEASDMTQKLNEAYEILGDEQKREEYDAIRKNPFMRMNSHNSNNVDIPIDEIFNAFFGGGFPGGAFPGMGVNVMGNPFGPGIQGFPGMPPGAKIHVFQHGALQKPTPIIKHIYITLEHVLDGSTVPLEIERWMIENNNKVFESETVYVTVPKGIDDGEIIVLRDKGNILNEHLKGDIKIFVKITNSTLFKRNGLDLILEKKISLKESLCGFSFEIKYVNGKSYTLNNNKGNIIPPEYRKVYPNMGLKRGDHSGNMIIHFHVDFPETLTEEQISKICDTL
jgi:DnaJ family protein B protein 11